MWTLIICVVLSILTGLAAGWKEGLRFVFVYMAWMSLFKIIETIIRNYLKR